MAANILSFFTKPTNTTIKLPASLAKEIAGEISETLVPKVDSEVETLPVSHVASTLLQPEA
jgi:hypothetical protein